MIQKAEQAKLAAIALTDHNSVAGLPEFLMSAKATNIIAVPGVEFTTAHMKDGGMNTIAVFFSDGTGLESDVTLYYMGFPFPSDLRADNFELDYQLITDEYLVTEEEYHNAESAIFDSDDYVVEVYSCPKELIIP